VRVLRELGEEIDRRPFHPHLTLARVKAPWRRADLDVLREGLLELEGESFPVSSLTLYESRPHPRGSRYERVRTFELCGGSPASGSSESSG
jgi:2'-5' RNA ligase